MINHPDFDFIKHLGSGGFGQVGLYTQKSTSRQVAIKTLRSINNPNTLARFKQEIEISKRLKGNPNVVQILSHDKNPEPKYYVMPYYKEGSFRDLLDQQPNFSDKKAIEIMMILVDTLIPIHNEGIIHRDLKPENILRDDHRQLKISDWGLGKPQLERGDTLTEGIGIGTQTYCAPEQLYGGNSDHRSDIYSLGVIFTELLTGSPQGKPKGQFTNQIINKATSNTPENRYKNLKELLTDLEKLSFRKGITGQWKKSRGYLTVLGVAGLAGLVGYTLYQENKGFNDKT